MSENWFNRKNRLYDSMISYDFTDKIRCNRNYIFQFLSRTQQIFTYTGLPETIPQKFLELYLQYNGFACIAEYAGKLYAFFGGLGGEPDEYYQPTICVVANQALKLNKTYTINKDCVIIRNDLFMYGLYPIINRYATALVENDITLNMFDKNMRSQIMITATSDIYQKAADKFITDLSDGKQASVGDNGFMSGIKVFPTLASGGQRITDLIEYQQYLKAGLFNEIGLDANYNMKRERLSNGETELNQDSLVPLIDHMLQQRQEGIEQVNKMFGTSITVSLSELWEQVREESTTSDIEKEEQTQDQQEDSKRVETESESKEGDSNE